VDGLVAVPAEERPVLHAEDEGRLLLQTSVDDRVKQATKSTTS
jgi:hypothetical protein